MYKKLFFTVTLLSTSIFPLNFDKEFESLKKNAAAIGSDAWDRASFEDNAVTAYHQYHKCKKEKGYDKAHEQKCYEEFVKKIDQQAKQDGRDLLKLLVTSLAVHATGKTIEYFFIGTTEDPIFAHGMSKTITTIPNAMIAIISSPLILNFMLSVPTSLLNKI